MLEKQNSPNGRLFRHVAPSRTRHKVPDTTNSIEMCGVDMGLHNDYDFGGQHVDGGARAATKWLSWTILACFFSKSIFCDGFSELTPF